MVFMCHPSRSDTGKVCNHGPITSTITNDGLLQQTRINTDNVARCEINLGGNKNEFADVYSHRTSDLHGEVNDTFYAETTGQPIKDHIKQIR